MIQRDNSKYNMFLKIIILRSFLASNYQLYFLIIIIRIQSVKLARDVEHTPIIKKTIEINFFFTNLNINNKTGMDYIQLCMKGTYVYGEHCWKKNLFSELNNCETIPRNFS